METLWSLSNKKKKNIMDTLFFVKKSHLLETNWVIHVMKGLKFHQPSVGEKIQIFEKIGIWKNIYANKAITITRHLFQKIDKRPGIIVNYLVIEVVVTNDLQDWTLTEAQLISKTHMGIVTAAGTINITGQPSVIQQSLIQI